MPAVAEDGDVRVEHEEDEITDAVSGVLDDRGAVEDDELLKRVQRSSVVPKTGLRKNLGGQWAHSNVIQRMVKKLH